MFGKLVVPSLVGAALLFAAPIAVAQTAGLPPTVIAAFQANPSQLLTQFPSGGDPMTKQVAALLTTDRSTLPAIIALLKTANEDQRNAIVAALAQVAKAYASSASQADRDFARSISNDVANSGLPEVAKAYAQLAGDTGTSSTGGGGGGGGPNNPGAPTGGPNTGGINTANSVVPNSVVSLLTGATLGSVGGSSSSTSVTEGGTTTTSTTSTSTTTTTTTTNNPPQSAPGPVSDF